MAGHFTKAPMRDLQQGFGTFLCPDGYKAQMIAIIIGGNMALRGQWYALSFVVTCRDAIMRFL
jgi:hypothetical protein|tara:strand:+ start:9769 stop:9957 length:189 start_codon:yes stop_codon:yes gene_type:complete